MQTMDRDTVIITFIKFADNEDSITKSIVKLTQNDTVSITIKGISNKDVTLTCLVVDGSLK